MHHTLMHQSHMHNDQGAYVYTSCILLLESPCPLVGWLVTKFQPHHTHMQHSQGLNITDVCIMHICIMIKEHMYMHRAYMHHVYMHQGLSMHDKYTAS